MMALSNAENTVNTAAGLECLRRRLGCLVTACGSRQRRSKKGGLDFCARMVRCRPGCRREKLVFGNINHLGMKGCLCGRKEAVVGEDCVKMNEAHRPPKPPRPSGSCPPGTWRPP